MDVLIPILLPFAAAFAAPMAVRSRGSSAGYWIAAIPAALLVYFAGSAVGLFRLPATAIYHWVPSLAVNVSFQADGLALLFAVLISGMGFLVTVYSAGYMEGHPQLGGYYGWLMTFTGAMLGLVLADNMLLLYVFWELTSITSFMLIGYEHEEEGARNAALQSLLVTSLGGLCLLAGIVLLGLAGGSFEFSVLLMQGGQLAEHPLYLPAIVLFLLGACTKSAQIPFHFWLPNAMVAPTPVSAYLHSAAMVKAGIYVLMRMSPALKGDDFWTYTLTAVGAATLLLGSYMVLSQTDLKLLLAYSTVSALGLLTLLVGLGTTYSLQAAVVFLFAHALYKGALFLVAGAVDHGTGTRDVRRLGGLFRAMPRTGIAAALAALSMAGVLPLFGGIAKEMSYEAGIEAGAWIGMAVVAGGISFVFAAVLSGLHPFWSQGADRSQVGPETSASQVLWLSPALLGVVSLAAGVFPGIASPFVAPAAATVTSPPSPMALQLWHGFNKALFLSLAGIAAGVLLYRFRDAVARSAAVAALKWGPENLYALAIRWMNGVAAFQTRILQTGHLHHYLTVIILTMVILVGAPLLDEAVYHWHPAEFLDIRVAELLVAALILLAALLSLRSKSILGAVAALGAAGYGVAVIYMLFGAPDLAMTQFLIESLTVILFVLVFYRFPSFRSVSSPGSRLFDAGVALAGGAIVTLLVLMAAGVQLHPPISEYFVGVAVPEGHGRNVVNVILVDFRALDTLGEVTVLGVAAIGVYALIKVRKGTSQQKGTRG